MGNAGGNRMEPIAFLFFLVHIVLIKCLVFPLMSRPEKESAMCASLNPQGEISDSQAGRWNGGQGLSENAAFMYAVEGTDGASERHDDGASEEDYGDFLGAGADVNDMRSLKDIPQYAEGDFRNRKKEVSAPRTGLSDDEPSEERFQSSGNVSAVLSPFDPNRADSMTFVRLGIPTRVVRNILNYRRKGGVFRQADDLAKIYGMETEVFERLRPYVRMVKPEIDLNRADSTQLTALRGIGAYTAHKILVYRRQLGGFYSLEQLGEIPDVRPDNLKELRQVARLDTSVLRKLNLASAGVGELRQHPYLDFYQAKAIVDFRSRQHRAPTLADLEMLEEFSEDDLKRLRPYLP